MKLHRGPGLVIASCMVAKGDQKGDSSMVINAVLSKGDTVKRCRECGKALEEGDDQYNPASGLGDIFLRGTDIDADDVCPKCKEELGIINLLGFED